MTAFNVTFQVEAEEQPDVRDLADDIKDAVRTAQKQGRHPGVTVVGGPTIEAAT